MRNRYVFKALLALILAIGLIISPLQATLVVQSARLYDDTPPPAEEVTDGSGSVDEPVAEASGETVAEETQPSAETSSENPAITSAPAETESTPEPADTEPVVIETPVSETIEIAETQPTTQPDIPVESISIPEEQVTQLPAIQISGSPESVPTVQSEEIQTTPITVVQSDSGKEEIQTVEESQWEAGKILLQYDTATNLEKLTARLNDLGYSISETGTIAGVITVNVPSGKEVESAAALQALAGIKYAEPVYLATALDLIPNDPGFPSQTDMVTIGAPAGWEYTTGSTGVIVAVIDTGINLSDPDFAGRLVQGYDFVNNDDTALDDNGHGTHIAGTIAATGNNGTEIAGLDWSAKIMPIKVLNSAGKGSELNVYKGIIYAVDHGAQIINLSLGMNGYSDLVASAVEYAYLCGVTVIAATGNTGTAVNFPASMPHVIAVGAVDDNENQLAFSNYGKEVDLVAPGKDVLSTGLTGLTYKSGTSMAAAHVTGLASLLTGISPAAPEDIEYAIESSSKDLGTAGWDVFFGNGLIQVRSAINRFLAVIKRVYVEDPDEVPSPTPVYPTFMPTPTMTPTVSAN